MTSLLEELLRTADELDARLAPAGSVPVEVRLRPADARRLLAEIEPLPPSASLPYWGVRLAIDSRIPPGKFRVEMADGSVEDRRLATEAAA